MLSVAFYLLRDGCTNGNGCNPACPTPGSQICGIRQITGQGSLADAIFFQTMLSSPQGSKWCDIRDTAQHVSSIFGSDVQQQVQNGFSSIGYFPLTTCQ
jgi:hypothetical protein